MTLSEFLDGRTKNLQEPDPLEMGVCDRTIYSRGQYGRPISKGELQRKIEKTRENLEELLKKYL